MGDLECCSRTCDGNTCVPAYSCQATGDICYRTEDCCSGLCPGGTATAPARCDAPSGGCTQDGLPCENDSNCCTRSCVDMGSGTKVCQPAGGCRMTGSYCDGTASCCGGSDAINPLTVLNPYGVFCDSDGRSSGPPEGDTSMKDERICTGGQACNPPGNICGYKASQNCCYDGGGSGKAVCKPDQGGILRCFGGPVNGTCLTGWDSNDPACCKPAGDVCQFRDQCCGLAPCVPDDAGVLRCAAATTVCKPSGAVCTGVDDTTCCEGSTCTLLEPGFRCSVGGGGGECQPNGSACTVDAECCSSGCDQGTGTCRVPCQGDGATCTVGSDCCAGLGCNVPAGATSGTCGGGTGPTCAATGQGCALDTDCCPGGDTCLEGVCAPAPTCGGASQTCVVDGDCCTGLGCYTEGAAGQVVDCTDLSGLGCFCATPPTTTCAEVNTSCSSTVPCCSGLCATANGLNLCPDGGTGCLCVPPG